MMMTLLLSWFLFYYRSYVKLLLNFIYNKFQNEAKLVDDCLVIHYTFEGQKHRLFLPYTEKLGEYKKVYLHKDDQKVDITQQQGLNYYITSSHLRGNLITVEDIILDESTSFTNKIPTY